MASILWFSDRWSMMEKSHSSHLCILLLAAGFAASTCIAHTSKLFLPSLRGWSPFLGFQRPWQCADGFPFLFVSWISLWNSRPWGKCTSDATTDKSPLQSSQSQWMAAPVSCLCTWVISRVHFHSSHTQLWGCKSEMNPNQTPCSQLYCLS